MRKPDSIGVNMFYELISWRHTQALYRPRIGVYMFYELISWGHV